MSEVRLGDWRDVLPGSYDPARAVVITDPPYGLGDVDRGYADDVPWAEHVAAVLDLLPAVRHVIRGPSVALIRRDYPQPRRLCVEVSAKRRGGPYRPGAIPHLWHGWIVYGRLRVAHHARPLAGDAMVIRPYVDDGNGGGRAGHRGMTPYGAALWIVETWTDPGMLVLDPFAGTGTIGRAAAAFGFDYSGAEINPRWHAEAQTSLAHSQPRLAL